jgi:hypothetical protein
MNQLGHIIKVKLNIVRIAEPLRPEKESQMDVLVPKQLVARHRLPYFEQPRFGVRS